jgi:hypothetical protein
MVPTPRGCVSFQHTVVLSVDCATTAVARVRRTATAARITSLLSGLSTRAPCWRSCAVSHSASQTSTALRGA